MSSWIPPACAECSGRLTRKSRVNPTLVCIECKREFGTFEIFAEIKN